MSETVCDGSPANVLQSVSTQRCSPAAARSQDRHTARCARVEEVQKNSRRVWPLFAGECALINEAHLARGGLEQKQNKQQNPAGHLRLPIKATIK
jgi:hypothetical protein